MEKVNRTIGGRARDRRKEMGMTLRDLSESASLSIGYLSDMENGKRGISAENLLNVCRALRVTPDWLFGPLLTPA